MLLLETPTVQPQATRSVATQRGHGDNSWGLALSPTTSHVLLILVPNPTPTFILQPLSDHSSLPFLRNIEY